MAPPQQVIAWLKRAYPKPHVDPEWLEACYAWIEESIHPDPTKDMDKIVHHLEAQLLQSDLSASMLPGTGLPADVSDFNDRTLHGPPILVEVISITEIGSSAFNLQNIRQARIEHADLAGLAGGDDDQDDENGTNVPKYPRSMLRFQLSDGATTLQAIEYRRLPQLELGETPLGFKMLLKNVYIRRGIAFLEPDKVELKYNQTEERQATADLDFARGLQVRLGRPVDDAAPNVQQVLVNNDADLAVRVPQRAAPAPAPAPAPVLPVPQQPPAAPAPSQSGTSRSRGSYDADNELPRRRKVPARPQRSSSPPLPSSSTATSSGRPILTYSKFFAKPPDDEEGNTDLARELRLSPHRTSPIPIPDSDEDKMDVEDDNIPQRRASPASSEYDWGNFDDGELLATLDQTEEAFGHVTGAATTTSRIQAPRAAVPSEPIYISDGDEKENQPAPTRRVRRRLMTPVTDEEIIELSD